MPSADRRNRENAGPGRTETSYDESRDHRGNGRSTDVASTQPVVKFTCEDYLTTPADERYELLDGDLIMVPAPNIKHQRVQLELATQLSHFIKNRALGELLIAPCDVVLSDTNIVQPDLLFVSREREHLLSDGEKVRGAPDLAVEILSPSSADKDRGLKRELYGRYGVTEYWLVDPDSGDRVDPSPTRRRTGGHRHVRSGTDTTLAAPRWPRTPTGRRLLVLRTSVAPLRPKRTGSSQRATAGPVLDSGARTGEEDSVDRVDSP